MVIFLAELHLWIFVSLAVLGNIAETYKLHPISDAVFYTNAYRRCENLGEEWHLPSGTNVTESLIDMMNASSFRSIWITIRRSKLPVCKWVNGKNCTSKCPDQTDISCTAVSLGHGSTVSPHLCADELVGRICEFTDCLNSAPSSQKCNGIRQTFYDIACDAQNWYKARLNCQRKGGHLAVLDDETKVHAITNNLAERLYNLTCTSFYVGLHCEDWLDSKNKELADSNGDNWDVNEPLDAHHQCTILVIDDKGKAKWQTSSCFRPHQVICELDTVSETRTKQIHVTYRTEKENSHCLNMTATEEYIRDTGKDNGVWKTISISLSAATGLLVLLLIIALIVIKRNYRGNCRQKGTEGETKKKTELINENGQQRTFGVSKGQQSTAESSNDEITENSIMMNNSGLRPPSQYVTVLLIFIYFFFL